MVCCFFSWWNDAGWIPTESLLKSSEWEKLLFHFCFLCLWLFAFTTRVFNVCVCGEGFILKFMCKVKMMCLLWAQRTNQLSRHLIDTGQSNLLWLIRMLYSYQTNLFLAITIVYGNQGMFWSYKATCSSWWIGACKFCQ